MKLVLGTKTMWIVGIIVVIGLLIWNWYDNKPIREFNEQYEGLIRYADRQAVEIRIFEQTAKLNQYRKAMVENQKNVKDKNKTK